MRRFLLILLSLVLGASAGAQRPRLKLDSLGLPPFPGAESVGNIRLPLSAILKPEPGQTMTGPKLTDLAIQTYRTTPTVPVERIADFYLKYAADAGWELLDDIPESPTNRALVFWSDAAPGYLTVEVLPGPENTRQIDLTRLLGEVDPSRPGEVMKLTGKHAREQRVEASYTGRFLNIKTNKFERRTLRALESRAESGLGPDAAEWIAPMTETYDVTWKVSDRTRRMTRAEAHSGNGTKIVEAKSPVPTNVLTLKGKIRGGQGMMSRVVIFGILPPPAPPVISPSLSPVPSPSPATPPPASSQPKAVLPTVSAGKAASAAKPAPAAAKPAVKPAAKPAGTTAPSATSTAAAQGAPPPPLYDVVLTEWYGLRPPRTAMAELRRGASTTRTEPIAPAPPVDLGPSCGKSLNRSVEWTSETTDEFTFPEDLFGNAFPRAQVGSRTGTLMVEFPANSGTSNTYALNHSKTVTTTQVSFGYTFNGAWVPLPSKKQNPQVGSYTVTVSGPPTVAKQSSGACPA